MYGNGSTGSTNGNLYAVNDFKKNYSKRVDQLEARFSKPGAGDFSSERNGFELSKSLWDTEQFKGLAKSGGQAALRCRSTERASPK